MQSSGAKAGKRGQQQTGGAANKADYLQPNPADSIGEQDGADNAHDQQDVDHCRAFRGQKTPTKGQVNYSGRRAWTRDRRASTGRAGYRRRRIDTLFYCVIILRSSMRQPRIKGQGQSFYHCVSRVVDGRFLFQTQSPGSVEAEYFVHLMRRLEKGCCLQVLTYALMANHFHILCKVPERRTLSDQELLDCIELGYGPERRTQVAEQLAAYAKEANLSDQAQQLRDHYLSRLFDVSIYMKELKGRFAQWYNRRHRRYGVLWAERFKSVLIEEGQALRAVAAYIDLNPLRAGLCEDPKDYRYCGYAEAIAKNSAQAKPTVTSIVLHRPESGSIQFLAVHALFLRPPASFHSSKRGHLNLSKTGV